MSDTLHPRAHPPVIHDSSKSAGIVSRGVAAFLDLLVVLAVLSGAYLGYAMVRLLFSIRDFSFPQPNVVFTATGFIVVSITYLTLCWAVSGRTLGSVAMGLRVVNHKGNRMRPVGALLRAVVCVLFAIGLVWVVVDRRRRSVADILLRTRVVYSR
ncbi:RDD family protein [Gordonia sp. SID5947]|uniref:RDD family protein n=1 Tax=Gordonia sp. SID5947 TaxID=2690315 RepID=UPI001367D15A|nr:RDD family protein [Gordonia sp. SID5947]MYR06502.1 RDD family protein [Gordonia sp. SID5947]